MPYDPVYDLVADFQQDLYDEMYDLLETRHFKGYWTEEQQARYRAIKDTLNSREIVSIS